MPSKSLKSYDFHDVTMQSISFLGEPGEDVTEKLKQQRARNKTLKDERDQIGREYDEIKKQLEKSEDQRSRLTMERERLDKEMEYLRRGHEESDNLRARITEIQRENARLKAEVSSSKDTNGKLKIDNEKITANLVEAIEEKDDMEAKLNDALIQLRQTKLRLDDEINMSTHAKEKAQKEAKHRNDEIKRLKELCSEMEVKLHSQRTEFDAQLKHRDSEIEELENLRDHLQNEVDWLKANAKNESPDRRRARVDESGLLLPDSSGSQDYSKEDSIGMENSKMEDLDDFFDNIQKHHGKAMKEQSANPELLNAKASARAERSQSPKSVGSRRDSVKSPKGRPSMLRRMSIFFLGPPQ